MWLRRSFARDWYATEQNTRFPNGLLHWRHAFRNVARLQTLADSGSDTFFMMTQ